MEYILKQIFDDKVSDKRLQHVIDKFSQYKKESTTNEEEFLFATILHDLKVIQNERNEKALYLQEQRKTS